MTQTAISAPFDGSYKPHDYLNGAIVALILYIIAKEPTVNHTKLEYYIISLNRMIKDATGVELFTWTLNRRRRIGNFSRFFGYMEGREFIVPNGRSHFVILKGASNILPRLTTMFRNLMPYLSRLLNKYGDDTATAMLKKI